VQGVLAWSWPERCLVGGGWQLRLAATRRQPPARMSGAGPAAALALKTQSRLGAADNAFAATAAAGQALNVAAAAAAAPAAAAAAPARPPAFHAIRIRLPLCPLSQRL